MKIYWALNQGNKITLPHINGSKKLEFKHVFGQAALMFCLKLPEATTCLS